MRSAVTASRPTTTPAMTPPDRLWIVEAEREEDSSEGTAAGELALAELGIGVSATDIEDPGF